MSHLKLAVQITTMPAWQQYQQSSYHPNDRREKKTGCAERDTKFLQNVTCFMLDVTNSLRLIGSQKHVTADVQKNPKLTCHH
jgi:hypothetical protein